MTTGIRLCDVWTNIVNNCTVKVLAAHLHDELWLETSQSRDTYARF